MPLGLVSFPPMPAPWDAGPDVQSGSVGSGREVRLARRRRASSAQVRRVRVRRWTCGAVDPTSRLERIYTASFPACELLPWQELVESIATGRRWLHSAVGAQGPIGLAVTHPLGRDAALLEYLAVAPHARNMGVGARLFNLAADDATRLGRRAGLFIEVEQAVAPDARERRLQERRLAFYLRWAAMVLPVPYEMPDLGSGPGPPSYLLWRSTGSGLPGPAEQEGVVRTIYREVYGMSDPDVGARRAWTAEADLGRPRIGSSPGRLNRMESESAGHAGPRA